MTHPFHPLRGREFELIDVRQAWGEYRVYYIGNDGELARLPAAWTDLAALDPCVVVGRGRADFRADDLVRLVALAADLRQRDV